MTINKTTSQMVPKISPQIKQELKTVHGEKAANYSNRIYKKLPEATSITLQRIKAAVLGKSLNESWFQLSKNPNEVLQENKAFFAAGGLALCGTFFSLLPKSVQKISEDKTINNLEKEVDVNQTQIDDSSSNTGSNLDQSSIIPSLVFAGGVLAIGLATVFALRNCFPTKNLKATEEKPKNQGNNGQPKITGLRPASQPPKTSSNVNNQPVILRTNNDNSTNKNTPNLPRLKRKKKPENITPPLLPVNLLGNPERFFDEGGREDFLSDEEAVYLLSQFGLQNKKPVTPIAANEAITPPNILSITNESNNLGTLATSTNPNSLDTRWTMEKLEFSIKESIPNLSWDNKTTFIKFAVKKLCELSNLDITGVSGQRNEPENHRLTTYNNDVVLRKNPQLLAKAAHIFISECDLLNITTKDRVEITETLFELCSNKTIDVECLTTQLQDISENGYNTLVELLYLLKKITDNQPGQITVDNLASQFTPMLFPKSELEISLSDLRKEIQIIKTLINNAEDLYENLNHSYVVVEQSQNFGSSNNTSFLSPTMISIKERIKLSTSPQPKSPPKPISFVLSPNSPKLPNNLLSPRSLSEKEDKEGLKLLDLKRKYLTTVTLKDLKDFTEPSTCNLDETSTSHLLDENLQAVESFSDDTIYPEKISDLLTSFLKERAVSANPIEKALYFGRDWDKYWNRLINNGKIKPSLKSFSENSKWIDRLSIEEELISSNICTKKVEKVEEMKGEDKIELESKNLIPCKVKFNFKSLRFHNLSNFTDVQCFFSDPNSFYAKKEIIKDENGQFVTSIINENPYLDEKWLNFFFGSSETWSDKTRIEKAILVKSVRSSSKAIYFDPIIYKQMMIRMLEPFITETNRLVNDISSQAHLTLIPLGIKNNSNEDDPGHKIQVEMSKLQVDCYLEIIKNHSLNNITCLDFSKFNFINARSLNAIADKHCFENQQKIKLVYRPANDQGKRLFIEIGSSETSNNLVGLRIEQTWEDDDQNFIEPRRLFGGERKRSEDESENLLSSVEDHSGSSHPPLVTDPVTSQSEMLSMTSELDQK